VRRGGDAATMAGAVQVGHRLGDIGQAALA
jgi:hypothetical protein